MASPEMRILLDESLNCSSNSFSLSSPQTSTPIKTVHKDALITTGITPVKSFGSANSKTVVQVKVQRANKTKVNALTKRSSRNLCEIQSRTAQLAAASRRCLFFAMGSNEIKDVYAQANGCKIVRKINI